MTTSRLGHTPATEHFQRHFRVFRITTPQGIAIRAPSPPDGEVAARKAIEETARAMVDARVRVLEELARRWICEAPDDRECSRGYVTCHACGTDECWMARSVLESGDQ